LWQVLQNTASTVSRFWELLVLHEQGREGMVYPVYTFNKPVMNLILSTTYLGS